MYGDFAGDVRINKMPIYYGNVAQIRLGDKPC